MSYFRVSRSIVLCCSAAIAWQFHAQSTTAGRPIWSGRSGSYAIEWSTANLKAKRLDNGRVVFDAAAEAKAAWAGFVRHSNGAPMKAQFTYRLLSAVGPYLSLEEATYCDCGGAHPTAVKRFRTVELERASRETPHTLTELFPERAVFTALTADPVVAKALGGAGPDTMAGLLDKLQDVNARVKDCEYGFPDDLLSSFAFYDAEGGNASVRLGLPSAVEVCRGSLIQLGLSLPVPEARRAWFRNAKERKDGLFMVDAVGLGRNVATSFDYSQKR